MADNQLTQAVEKLNHALVKLQEIQNTLRGQRGSDKRVKDDAKSPKPISRLERLNEEHKDPAHGSVDWRRWSTPAPLMHQVASELVAASKLAKKTNDIMKAHRIHPQKDSNVKEHAEITLLHPTTKANLLVSKPSKVKKLDKASKENNKASKENNKASRDPRRRRRSSLPSFQAAEGYINSLKFSQENEPAQHLPELEEEDCYVKKKNNFGKENAGDMLKDMKVQTDVKLRELMKAEDARDRQWHDMNGLDGPEYLEMMDLYSHNHHRRTSCINLDDVPTNQSLKKSADPGTQPEFGFDSASPFLPKGRFPLQVEEVRASRRKSWAFSSSDRAVVMFPNPAFDQTSGEQKDPSNRAQLDQRSRTKRTKDGERNRIHGDQPSRAKNDQRNRAKHEKQHTAQADNGNRACVDRQIIVKDDQINKAHIDEHNQPQILSSKTQRENKMSDAAFLYLSALVDKQNRVKEVHVDERNGAQILCSKTQRDNKLNDAPIVYLSAKKAQDIVTLLPTNEKDMFVKKEKLVRLAPCPSIKPRADHLRYENLRTEARSAHGISRNSQNVLKSDSAVKPKEKSFSLLPNNILPWKQISKEERARA